MAPQYILNAVASGSNSALLAVGFSLVFMVSRFFDFSLAIIIIVPAYTLAFGANLGSEYQLIFAFLGLGLAIALTLALYGRLYLPILAGCGNPLPPTLASLGVYTALSGGLALLFGDDVVSFQGEWSTGASVLLGSRMTNAQILALASAPIALLSVGAFLKFSRVGKAVRGLFSNEELAVVTGLGMRSIRRLTITAGAFLVGGAGLLTAYDVGVTPQLGFGLFLNAVAAALIAGVGRFVRTYLVAILLAGIQQAAAVLVGMEWADAVTFSVLVIALAFIAPKYQSKNSAGLSAP